MMMVIIIINVLSTQISCNILSNIVHSLKERKPFGIIPELKKRVTKIHGVCTWNITCIVQYGYVIILWVLRN